MPLLAAAEEERTVKWETVLLLGTDTTVVRMSAPARPRGRDHQAVAGNREP